jgi:hypothetical protein
MTFEEKIKKFAKQVTEDQQDNLIASDLACQTNMTNAIASHSKGQKYWKVNVGGSGKFMVEIETEIIYGIKGYGQVHKGHAYGTLDTIEDYYWGGYDPVKRTSYFDQREKQKKAQEQRNNQIGEKVPLETTMKAMSGLMKLRY